MIAIYSYPANCGIPIDELVVVADQSTELVDDEKTGETKFNSDGSVVEKTTIYETTYYQWNGDTHRKIRPIKGK